MSYLNRLSLFVTTPFVAVTNLFLIAFPISLSVWACLTVPVLMLGSVVWLMTGYRAPKAYLDGSDRLADYVFGNHGDGVWRMTKDWNAYVNSWFEPKVPSVGTI